MDDDRLYIVAYDIADQKRWRRIFKIMNGYGEWLQLSIFQCRLSKMRHAELIELLDEVIHHDHDHVVIVDVGLADKVEPKITSLGQDFSPVERGPVIV